MGPVGLSSRADQRLDAAHSGAVTHDLAIVLRGWLSVFRRVS
jgi:hypothetical protein